MIAPSEINIWQGQKHVAYLNSIRYDSPQAMRYLSDSNFESDDRQNTCIMKDEKRVQLSWDGLGSVWVGVGG